MPIPYTQEELKLIEVSADKNYTYNKILRDRYDKDRNISDEYKRKKPKRADAGSKRVKYISTLSKQYKSYLMRANQKGITFDFTEDEFNSVISKDCVYCGETSANGIDRIQGKKGYTKDNSVPCCQLCNFMKYTHTTDKFLRHVNKIYEFQNK